MRDNRPCSPRVHHLSIDLVMLLGVHVPCTTEYHVLIAIPQLPCNQELLQHRCCVQLPTHQPGTGRTGSHSRCTGTPRIVLSGRAPSVNCNILTIRLAGMPAACMTQQVSSTSVYAVRAPIHILVRTITLRPAQLTRTVLCLWRSSPTNLLARDLGSLICLLHAASLGDSCLTYCTAAQSTNCSLSLMLPTRAVQGVPQRQCASAPTCFDHRHWRQVRGERAEVM